MKKAFLLLAILASYTITYAQLPAQWPIANTQITARLTNFVDSVNIKADTVPYCTQFSGNLMLANSNNGFQLFSSNPPAPPNAAFQANLLNHVDSMLKAYDSLGYKAVDITIDFPLLVDSFPHSSDYLSFYKQVYQLARARGLKIINNCEASAADSVFGEKYMILDAYNFYFHYGSTGTDTLNAARYKRQKLQMMQTIIDSLSPDYMTVEMAPSKQAANLYNLVPFTPDSVQSYVRYFISHLNKGTTQIGAGTGTWDTLAYMEKIAPLGVDYIDYHIYPTNGNNLVQKVFEMDSIAKANNKKIVIGEAWCGKLSDSEYTNVDPLTGEVVSAARNVFNYWKDIDTLFIHAMVRHAQQAKVELVSFFYSNVMFGQLTYNPAVYGSMPYKNQIVLGEKSEYSSMLGGVTGQVGVYTRSALAHVCDTGSTDTTHTGGVPTVLPSGSILVYPNPSTGNFAMAFGIPLATAAKLTLSDMYGRVIYQHTIAKGSSLYNINETLNAGIYLLQVNEDNVVFSRKVVIH